MTISKDRTLPVDPALIPDWVCWLAQDADGAWWGYSVEPLEYHQGWYENEVGERICLARTAANPQWRNSLLRLR